MLKTTFRFLILGVTVIVATASTHAASIEYSHGEFRRTPAVTPASAVEPLAWIDEEDSQVMPTSFMENLGDAVGYGGKGDCCNSGCVGGWRDNTQVWVGADAFQNLGDTARSLFNPLPFPNKNNFGAVAGFNTGVGLGDSNVRGQVGASYGVYDWRGRLNIANNSAQSSEQQVYVTFGFYKPSDVCCGDRVSWGVVYDHFFAEDWGIAANTVSLSQMRWIGGYALNDCYEVGVWGTFNTNRDSVILGQNGASPPSRIRAMNQANAYLRHNWAFGGNSMFYVGTFDPADVGSWQFGLLNTAPLSNSVSLYGNFNYVAPGATPGNAGAAEEAWNVSAGLVFYLGGNSSASSVSGNRGMPLLPVANNGSFLVTD